MKKLYYVFLFILVTALLLSLIGCTGTTVTVVQAPFTTTQTTTTTASVPSTIATVQSMGVGFDFSNNGAPILDIHLIPSTRAIANEQYTVDLYDEGNYRDSTTVSWNQPEINVGDSAEVKFPTSQTEETAYYGKDVSGVFSIKVIANGIASSTLNNSNTVTTTQKFAPGVLISSPKSGDYWVVGNTVTITWTSVSAPSDTNLDVVLRNSSGTEFTIGTTKNTGSFQWTVTNQVIGTVDLYFHLELTGINSSTVVPISIGVN